MRVWLSIALLILTIAAARAIPRSDQIIIFGKQGSASGGAGCTGTSLSFTTVCNSMYVPIIH